MLSRPPKLVPIEASFPEITEIARKVGGFKRLSEIAAQLDRAGAGR